MIIINWYSSQFNEHYDGDSISIYKVDTDRSSTPILITKLSGPDKGPKTEYAISNWDVKAISTSSNYMMVEFKSDDQNVDRNGKKLFTGFSATIRFTLMKNITCDSRMDVNNRILQSPNYPNSYGSNMFCKYLITVQPNFHITLDFLEFDVRFLIIPI